MIVGLKNQSECKECGGSQLCKHGTKRPEYQIFEGKRHKKQKITGLAILAGNIQFTDDDDYWSIKSYHWFY